jgi:charged multivesicular body protein 6
MGNSLGKKNDKQRITPRDRAILDLKVQRDRLKQYQKKVSHIVVTVVFDRRFRW